MTMLSRRLVTLGLGAVPLLARPGFAQRQPGILRFGLSSYPPSIQPWQNTGTAAATSVTAPSAPAARPKPGRLASGGEPGPAAGVRAIQPSASAQSARAPSAGPGRARAATAGRADRSTSTAQPRSRLGTDPATP